MGSIWHFPQINRRDGLESINNDLSATLRLLLCVAAGSLGFLVAKFLRNYPSPHVAYESVNNSYIVNHSRPSSVQGSCRILDVCNQTIYRLLIGMP